MSTAPTATPSRSEDAAVSGGLARGCAEPASVDGKAKDQIRSDEDDAFAAGDGEESEDYEDEDGAESGGFFGGKYAVAWAKAGKEGEDDVLDEALDALLDAEVEGAGKSYVNRFTDDFDVLAAQTGVGVAKDTAEHNDFAPAKAASAGGDRKRQRTGRPRHAQSNDDNG